MKIKQCFIKTGNEGELERESQRWGKTSHKEIR